MENPCSNCFQYLSDSAASSTDAIYRKFHEGSESLYQGYLHLGETIGGFSGYIGYRIGSGCVYGAKKVGRGLYAIAAPAGREVKAGAKNTADFIRDNWPRLLAYLAGWAVIVLAAGFMHGFNGSGIVYGFKAVSLPLVIGMSCGIAFGLLMGILVVKGLESKKTLWNMLNAFTQEKIADFGTRQIMIGIAVTVILALSYRFPYASGGLFGVFIGNQLVTKIAFRQKLGRDPNKIKDLSVEISETKLMVEQIDQKIAKLESSTQRKELEEIKALKKQLAEKLEKLEKPNVTSAPEIHEDEGHV